MTFYFHFNGIRPVSIFGKSFPAKPLLSLPNILCATHRTMSDNVVSVFSSVACVNILKIVRAKVRRFPLAPLLFVMSFSIHALFVRASLCVHRPDSGPVFLLVFHSSLHICVENGGFFVGDVGWLFFYSRIRMLYFSHTSYTLGCLSNGRNIRLRMYVCICREWRPEGHFCRRHKWAWACEVRWQFLLNISSGNNNPPRVQSCACSGTGYVYSKSIFVLEYLLVRSDISNKHELLHFASHIVPEILTWICRIQTMYGYSYDTILYAVRVCISAHPAITLPV